MSSRATFFPLQQMSPAEKVTAEIVTFANLIQLVIQHHTPGIRGGILFGFGVTNGAHSRFRFCVSVVLYRNVIAIVHCITTLY